MGNEPETTQVKKVPSETPSLDKTLNSKCHNKIWGKSKDDQKKKRQGSPKMKDKEIRKRKYSLWLDESDSDSGKDSLLEDSILTLAHQQNLQRKKCPETSSPLQGSPLSLQRKRVSGNSEKCKTQPKFLKHILCQQIKDSILENNPVPRNFLSRQKIDVYWKWKFYQRLRRRMIKARENMANIMKLTTRSLLGTLRSPEGI